MSSILNQKKVNPKKVYLTVYNLIKLKHNTKQIKEILKLSKQALFKHTSRLKHLNMIKKVGYGEWEINPNPYQKKVNPQENVYTPQQKGGKTYPNIDIPVYNIRGHSFEFHIKVNNSIKWQNRFLTIQKLNIPFKKVKNNLGNMLIIFYEGKKIKLCKESIIIYDKSSYLSDSAQGSKIQAINNMFSLLDRLEKILEIPLKIDGDYVFKVSRQHFADLNNALAKELRKTGEKLSVADKNGIWLVADFSNGIDELETVHPKTGARDMDYIIKPFFNEVKVYKDFTPKNVLKRLSKLEDNLYVVASGTKAYIERKEGLIKEEEPQEEEKPQKDDYKPDYFG